MTMYQCAGSGFLQSGWRWSYRTINMEMHTAIVAISKCAAESLLKVTSSCNVHSNAPSIFETNEQLIPFNINVGCLELSGILYITDFRHVRIAKTRAACVNTLTPLWCTAMHVAKSRTVHEKTITSHCSRSSEQTFIMIYSIRLLSMLKLNNAGAARRILSEAEQKDQVYSRWYIYTGNSVALIRRSREIYIFKHSNELLCKNTSVFRRDIFDLHNSYNICLSSELNSESIIIYDNMNKFCTMTIKHLI